MRFNLLLALFMVCGQVLGASRLNLASYHLERVVNNETKEPEYTEWQNILCFSNTDIRIPLAREAMTRTPGTPDFHQGFDPASLKLNWLQAEKLLLISWSTSAAGSGKRVFAGHVLVQMRGAKVNEVFRDCFMSDYNGGWFEKDYASLAVTYDNKTRIVKLSRRDIVTSGQDVPFNPPQPLTEAIQGDNGMEYRCRVNRVKTWFYRLDAGELIFLRGTDALDLEEGKHPIEEIIQYSHSDRAVLEKLNPSLRGQKQASGVLILSNKVTPYKAESNDGLWGGE